MKTMDCRRAEGVLSAYGDGELELTQALALEDHLARCASCAAALESQRALGDTLRRQMPYHPATSALIDTLRTSLPAESGAAARATLNGAAKTRVHPSRRRLGASPSWARWGAPIAAGLLLAAGLNGILTQRQDDVRLADDVVASHVRSLMADHLDDIASSDHHTVKPWFAGKLDFSPPVKDFADAGYALAGGRLDYLGGRAVAALDYRHGPHIINLFIWPSREENNGSTPRTMVREGYNLESWSQGGMNYWAVSDLNPSELEIFVRLQER